MGKRSDFERKPRDYYRTFDLRAGKALEQHIKERSTYIEPFAGRGDLVDQLTFLKCVGMTDIEPQREDIIQRDAFDYTADDFIGVDYCISNPPWDRKLLHPLISHYAEFVPTWFLFDSDWLFNVSSAPIIDKYLKEIVAIGRMKWDETTNMSGKDNCAWYLFDVNKTSTIFHSRR